MFNAYISHSEEETIALGLNLSKYLKAFDNVFIYGDMGSGKTYFTKGIALGLGIKKTIKSPTYIYLNEYKLENFDFKLNHYDLYRLSESDDFSSIDLYENINNENINIIEWSEKLDTKNIKNKINVIFKKKDENTREINIEFMRPSIVSEKDIDEIFDYWKTPQNIINHCKQVGNISLKIINAYIKKNRVLNSNLIYTASLIHDFAKLCDVYDLKKEDRLNVTDEIWERWIFLREKHKNIDHADIAFNYLNKKGFTETAELIRMHNPEKIITEAKNLNILENMIIFYADKRVKHEKIVDLKERFRDGRERYGQNNDPEKTLFFDKIEEETIKLEKRLFKDIDIEPEDIK